MSRQPQQPQSGGGVFRKIVAAVILIPLAVVIIAFAVANRHMVTVSLDPFSAEAPAATFTLPLFALVIGLLILGVVIGGVASWLRHGRLRRALRRLDREAAALRAELAAHRQAPSVSPGLPETAKPPERLQLSPPVR